MKCAKHLLTNLLHVLQHSGQAADVLVLLLCYTKRTRTVSGRKCIAFPHNVQPSDSDAFHLRAESCHIRNTTGEDRPWNALLGDAASALQSSVPLHHIWCNTSSGAPDASATHVVSGTDGYLC